MKVITHQMMGIYNHCNLVEQSCRCADSNYKTRGG